MSTYSVTFAIVTGEGAGLVGSREIEAPDADEAAERVMDFEAAKRGRVVEVIVVSRKVASTCRFNVSRHAECFDLQAESGQVGCVYHGSH